MQSPPVTPAAHITRRPAVARGLAAAAGLLLITAAVGACSSSASSSSATGGHKSGSGASSSSSSSSSSGSSGKAKGGTRTTAKKGKAIPGLISFKGHLELSGAKKQHLSFTAFPGVTSPASSCARIAAGGTPVPAGKQRQFTIPSPSAGSKVYFVAEISPYHGPGTYDKASILAVGATFMVGADAFNPLAPAASATATLRADGSGSFTFHGATAAKPAKGTISGTISWTCSG